MRLHRFHGGLRLPAHKAEAAASPLRRCPLPERLVLPMLQHAGEPARPCVEVGARVVRGDLLGAADEPGQVPVHAPADGVVETIEAHPLAHASGLAGLCVVLRIEDASPVVAASAPIPAPTNRNEALARIRAAGIVGLGGAGFPTGEKLAVARRTLILNGAECEPWIACDDRLLQDRAPEVIAGGLALAPLLGADRVLLAIEDGMPEALAAARRAAAATTLIEVIAVPTVYPQGGERQLIRVLTGQEVPSGGLPRDIGVLVLNVATAAACWRALSFGEALTSRVVSVTGPGVRAPGNFEVALGTPIAHLIEQAGGYTDDAARLLVGGPLMGLALPSDDVPVGKTVNCVLVLTAADLRAPAPASPCIRCGDCAAVCPAVLLPQQLYANTQARRWDRLADDGLFDCIECGCCDLVCPSHIPLVEQFRFAKSELRAREREAALAAGARARFEQRRERLQHERARRAEQQAARQAAATPAAVQAALERARARRDGDESPS